MAILHALIILSSLLLGDLAQGQFYNPSTATPQSANLKPEDFTFALSASTGSAVLQNANGKLQPLTDAQEPALNGSGVGMVLFTINPCSYLAPHAHPRATETFFVVEGTINAGVVLEQGDNRLINATVPTGNTFVYPQGLLHFAENSGCTPAVMISTLNSENAGTEFYPKTFLTLPTNLVSASLGGAILQGTPNPPIPFGPLPQGTCSCAPGPAVPPSSRPPATPSGRRLLN